MSKAIEGAALLVGGVALGLLSGGAGTLALFSALNYGMDLLLVGGAAMLAGAVATALTSNRGMGITTRQPAAARQIVYGTRRVGGILVYQSTTGSATDQYNFVIVLAGHEVDAIENLYLDGRQVYWLGSGAGYSVRNGVGFGGVADANNHTGPTGQQYNFGGTGHSGLYCEARFGDQMPGDVIGGLTANDANWAASGGNSPWLGGCTYVYLKIEYNASLFPQLPEIQFTLRGKNNIWDPRTNTKGYTSNSALVLADKILDTQFGLGDVEAFQDSGSLAQLIAAANVCDEQSDVEATGGTEARYCSHEVYDASTAPGDAMQQTLASMGGRVSMPGGEWFIFPAYWQGASFTFDDNDLRGSVAWEPQRGFKDLINRVHGVYTAANYPYNTSGNLYDGNGFWNGMTANYFALGFQATDYPQYAQDPQHGYAADQYLQEDSNVLGAWAIGTTYNLGDVITYSGTIYKSLVASNAGNEPDTATADWVPYQNLLPFDLSLQSVLSITQAQRLAKIKLERNRQQGSGDFPMGLATRAMMCCDVMQFTWGAMGWSEKTLECEGAKWGIDYQGDAPKETTELHLIETSANVYEWDPTTEELTPYDQPAVPTMQATQPAPPTGMSLTSAFLTSATGLVTPRIEVQWTTPADVLTIYIQVRYALVTGGTPGPWISAGTADVSLNAFYVGGVVAGLEYDVQIRGVRASGASSVWVEIDGFTVGGIAVATQLALAPGSLVAEVKPGFTFTGDIATGVAGIDNAFGSGIADGIAVTGTGMPTGTTVTSVIIGSSHAPGHAPPTSLGISNPATANGTGLTFTSPSTLALIIGTSFTTVIGNTTVTVSPSNYPLTVANQGQLYWVYYIDPALAGGAVTAIATQNQADFLNKSGYFLIDSIVTPVQTSGGGARYYPSTFVDSGSRTTQSPTGVYAATGIGSVVSGSIFFDGFGDPPTATDGIGTWGFPAVTLAYAAELTVIAIVTLDPTIGVTASIAASGGVSGSLLSTTTGATLATYTLGVPASTDLSTIFAQVAVPCTGATYAGGTSPLTETPQIQILAMYIQ